MKMTTKEICVQGLLTALVAVSTMVFQIPVSATNGYIHLGDSMIFLTSVFFGWRYGMVAGGIGSGLADVLSSYGHWAPFTLIIKGIMGLVVGKIAGEMKDNGGFLKARNFVATIVGGIWMVFGYFIGGGILKSSFAISAVSIPENCVQAAGGIIVFFAVGIAFYRAKIYKLVS